MRLQTQFSKPQLTCAVIQGFSATVWLSYFAGAAAFEASRTQNLYVSQQFNPSQFYQSRVNEYPGDNANGCTLMSQLHYFLFVFLSVCHFFFLLHSLLFNFIFFYYFSFYNALETVKLSAVWPLISHSFQTDRWSRHSSLRCCFQTAFSPFILFVSEPKQLSTESQHQQPQPQVVRGQKSRLLLLPWPSIICKLAWGAISQTNAP